MSRMPLSLSSVLGGCCRLSGFAAAALVLRLCLSRELFTSTLPASLQLGAALALAVLIGGIVRECAFALMEVLVPASGHPFLRKTLTVTGKRVSELWLPDGKWVRCKTWHSGAALAWSERDGSCSEIEMPAVTAAGARPGLPHTVSYSREQLQGRMRAASFSAARLQAQALKEPFEEAAKVRLSAAPAGSRASKMHREHVF